MECVLMRITMVTIFPCFLFSLFGGHFLLRRRHGSRAPFFYFCNKSFFCSIRDQGKKKMGKKSRPSLTKGNRENGINSTCNVIAPPHPLMDVFSRCLQFFFFLFKRRPTRILKMEKATKIKKSGFFCAPPPRSQLPPPPIANNVLFSFFCCFFWLFSSVIVVEGI